MEKILFLVGCCPPPDWLMAMYEDCLKSASAQEVSVLLWGEGVYNSPDRFPRALVSRRDSEGRGLAPGDRALTDGEAARMILQAARVVTCS
jgi:hypothetical protein